MAGVQKATEESWENKENNIKTEPSSEDVQLNEKATDGGSGRTKASNSFATQLQTNCFDTIQRPQSDVDSFEKLFEAWKKQYISGEQLDKNSKNESEFIQRKLLLTEQKLKDISKSNDLLQKVIHSLHTELNVMENIEQDNKSLKNKLKQMQEKLLEKDNDIKSKISIYEDLLAQEKQQSANTIENMNMKITKQLEETNSEKNKQVELLKEEIEMLKEKLEKAVKAKDNEIAALTVEYEDKFAKLQRLKASSGHNQLQSSSNQEIFRKKLQQLRSEYEFETKSLNEQIKTLQYQIVNSQTQRNAQSARQTVSPVPPFAKRPRKF